MMTLDRKQLVLVVLDGWGVAPPSRSNAITIAKTPNYQHLLNSFPHTSLQAAGAAVGLKADEPGNSEAGHLNLGGGRLVLQEKMWITATIHDGSFFQNRALSEGMQRVLETGSKLHLVGLLSDGHSAHSEPDHLEALLVMCKKMRLEKVYLHLFTDGRDSPPKGAGELIRRLELLLDNLGVGRIATVGGRYYGMDRAGNWERTGLAYEAMVMGQGPQAFTAYEAVQESYRRGITDEFILPTVITRQDGASTYTKDAGVKSIGEKDGVVFFNLRSDRARQLVKAFVQNQDCKSDTYDCRTFRKFKKLHAITLSDFGSDLPVQPAFIPPRIENCLSRYLAKYPSVRQLYVAEREKFAHVTYFFHGGAAKPEAGETRLRIDSARVTTFDRAPEMSAAQITAAVVRAMEKKIYNLTVVNYANADMLGHTGLLRPTVKAIEILDQELGKLAEAALTTGTSLLITADHGNAEQMRDPLTRKVDTAHSTNPVPFVIVDKRFSNNSVNALAGAGSLRDVAPTILELLDVPQPREMSGTSLLHQ